MLVNPAFLSLATKQAPNGPDRPKEEPLVAKTRKINKGGPQRARPAEYDRDDSEEAREDRAEYLGERRGNLSLYA